MKNILRNLARKLFPVKSGWTRFSRGQKSFYKGMKENKLSGENLTLKDSENNIISIDDILYDGVDYYRIYINHLGEFEMLSCTNGYIHNVQPNTTSKFKIVGPFLENKHLLKCDCHYAFDFQGKEAFNKRTR